MEIIEEEFNKVISEFETFKERGAIYWRAKEIIKSNPKYTVDAIILLLSTWNVAHFSNVLKGRTLKNGNKWEFNYNKIKSDVMKILPIIDEFKELNIKTLNIEDNKEKISEIYEILENNDNIRNVGATKIMMLLNDNVFIAWDGDIKKWYEIKSDNSEDYIRFLLLMQENFKNINLSENNKKVREFERGIGKAIDEYNFQKVRQNKNDESD